MLRHLLYMSAEKNIAGTISLPSFNFVEPNPPPHQGPTTIIPPYKKEGSQSSGWGWQQTCSSRDHVGSDFRSDRSEACAKRLSHNPSSESTISTKKYKSLKSGRSTGSLSLTFDVWFEKHTNNIH